MGFALAAAWNSPGCFRRRIEIRRPRGRGLSKQDRCFLFLHSDCRQLSTSCSIKLPTAEYFGDPEKAATYLKTVSESLSKSLPEPVREFPWKKAENMVMQRLLFWAEEALKWFFAGFFVTNFISDTYLSISRNRELMIPLGLFAGVAMADLMKETSQELIQGSKKNWSMERCLLTIGFFFLAIKFAVFYSTIPGKIFLSHVSNGGLMQVLWLIKKLKDTKNHLKEEQSSPTSGIDIQSTEPDSNL